MESERRQGPRHGTRSQNRPRASTRAAGTTVDPDLLAEALDQRWEKYHAELETCRGEFSDEAVHDLRVAARRLLATLDMARTLVRQPRIKKLARVFKVQLDGMDELRDTQVMLADISENLKALPELEPFRIDLQKREKRLLRAARKQVKSLKPGSLRKRLASVREMIADPAVHADLSARILQAVDDAYLTVLQRRELVDSSNPPTIHRLRVAFKKFRHMIEIVQSELPGFPEENLGRMHNLQAAMGEIQDIEVFLRALADYCATDESFDPAHVRRSYEKRLSAALAALPPRLGEIDGFWRSAPGGPLPWARGSARKTAARNAS